VKEKGGEGHSLTKKKSLIGRAHYREVPHAPWSREGDLRASLKKITNWSEQILGIAEKKKHGQYLRDTEKGRITDRKRVRKLKVFDRRALGD